MKCEEFVYKINQVDEYFDWIMHEIKDKYRNVCGSNGFCRHILDDAKVTDLEQHRPKNYVEAVQKMKEACDALLEDMAKYDEEKVYEQEIPSLLHDPSLTIIKKEGQITILDDIPEHASLNTYVCVITDPFSHPSYRFGILYSSATEISYQETVDALRYADSETDKYCATKQLLITESMWKYFQDAFFQYLKSTHSTIQLIWQLNGHQTWGILMTEMMQCGDPAVMHTNIRQFKAPITIEVENDAKIKISKYMYNRRSW